MSRKYFRILPTFVVAIIVAAALALGAYASPLVRAFAAESDQLANIIDKDESGNALMYTTLIDADGKVVATNDPNREVDTKYKFASEGGEDAGVKAGDQITVHFRLASVTPNGAEGEGTGVQEGTTYTAALPTELVPVEKDSDGKQLLNTETTFFNSGTIEAKGGIYSAGSGYELRMNFTDVADQLDISGEFQYVTKVSDAVKAGTTVTQNYNPGGTVKFHITPGETPAPAAQYELMLSGKQDNANVYAWTAIAENKAGGTFDYKQLAVVADEGSGFAIDGTEWTYTLAIDGTAYTAKGSGATVKFDGIDASVTVAKTSAGELISADGSQFISKKITLQLPEGLNATKVVLIAPARPYNDYKYSFDTSNATYTATATLTDSSTASNITATGSAEMNLGSFGNSELTLGAGTNNPTQSYGYITSEIHTGLTAKNSSYAGNYYWVEYAPDTNNAGAVYYFNNASFVAGNKFNSSTQPANNATFGEVAGVAGSGGNIFGWESGKTLSASALTSVSGIMNALNTNDVKLAYQIKQVFSDATADLVYYKSTNTYGSNGKYAYIFVDPATTATAAANKAKGWSEYIDSTSGSAKPGTWKLHVFNAPQSNFVLANAYQEQGAVWNNDYDNNNGSALTNNANVGTITDKASTGLYTQEVKNTTGTLGIPHHRNTTMTGIRLDDDTIFWEFTVTTSQLPAFTNGYVYIGLGDGLSLGSGDTVTIDNQTLDAHTLYVKNYNASSNPWVSLGSSFGSYYGSAATVWDMSDSTTLDRNNYSSFYKWAWGNTNLKDYATNETPAGDGSGLVTLGFATKVTGDHASYNSNNMGDVNTSTYYATVELVAQAGDVSRFTSPNGTNLPTTSAGAQAQYPFKLSATANTNYPEMAKTGEVSTNKDDGSDIVAGKTTANWALNFSGMDKLKGGVIANSPYFYVPYFTGYYSGRLFAGDSMEQSTVTDSTGKVISSISAGKYNHVTTMFSNGISISEPGTGGGCGPIPYMTDKGIYGDTGNWQKYVNGTWVTTNSSNYWEPEKAGIYRAIIGTGGENDASQNPLTITVFYAGNMGTSVHEAFNSANISIPGDCDFELSNRIASESLVVEYDGLEHAQERAFQSGILYTTEMDDQALLDAVNQLDAYKDNNLSGVTANLTNAATLSSWKAANKEASSTTVSKSISAALAIFKETPAISEAAGETLESVDYTLKAQVGESASSYLELEDYITGYTDTGKTGSDSDKTTYKADSDEDSDGSKAVKALADCMIIDKSAITITAVDAYGNKLANGDVYKNGSFTDDWTGSEFETRAEIENSGSSLLTSSLKPGTLFRAYFKLADGSDIPVGTVFKIEYTATLNMDGDANGSTGFRSSSYYKGGQLKVDNGATAIRPYTGTGNTAGMLTVDCKGDVTATFLNHPVVIKSKFTTVDTTGTEPESGWANRTSWMVSDWTGSMGKNDTDTYTFSDALSFNLTNVAKDKQLDFLQLMANYLTISNVKVYVLDEQPTEATIKDQTASWTFTDSYKSTDATKTVTSTDGKCKLTYTQAGVDNTDPDNPKLVYPGFSLSADGINRNKWLTATYDIDFDKTAFFKEAVEKGLLTKEGYVTGTKKTPYFSLKNTASSGWNDASATSNQVHVSAATLTKTVVANEKDGSATWTINANTGNSGAPGATTTISDTLTFTGEQAAAAKAATTVAIDSVRVGSDVLDATDYELTATPSTTENKIELVITIKKQLGQSQSIRVIYKSTLNKTKFIENLTGGSDGVSDVSYTIANSASMSVGGSTATGSVDHGFKPDVPVSASKELTSTSWNGTEVTFKATGEAKDATRTNFTMADTVTAPDDTTAKALELTSLSATVTKADNTTATYTYEQLTANSGAGTDSFKLTTGKLNEPGTYNWTLVASTLEAGAKIEVTYSLKADRATYIANKGALDTNLTLSNKLEVSTRAGFSASTEAEGTIKVMPDIKKTGTTLATKAASGNPIIQWVFQVDISQMYTKEELANLKTITIKDKLDQMLIPDMDSIKVAWADGTKTLTKDSDYTTSLDSDNTLEININNPSDNPVVVITVNTECTGSLDELKNSVDLIVDGTTKGGDTTTVDGIVAISEYGRVTSATVPMWAAAATKTVDGAAPGEKTFNFTLQEIDENGTAVKGGISATATNDAEGNIKFGTVSFKKRPVVGTHHFKISEVSDDASAGYTLPDDIYVDVEVTKTDGGTYTATASVVKGDTNYTLNNVTNKKPTTQPSTTQPATTKPATTKPATTQPSTTKPATTKPTSPESPSSPEAPTTDNKPVPNNKPTEETSKKKVEIPQTGDSTPYTLMASCAIAGTALLGTSFALKRKR